MQGNPELPLQNTCKLHNQKKKKTRYTYMYNKSPSFCSKKVYLNISSFLKHLKIIIVAVLVSKLSLKKTH